MKIQYSILCLAFIKVIASELLLHTLAFTMASVEAAPGQSLQVASSKHYYSSLSNPACTPGIVGRFVAHGQHTIHKRQIVDTLAEINAQFGYVNPVEYLGHQSHSAEVEVDVWWHSRSLHTAVQSAADAEAAVLSWIILNQQQFRNELELKLGQEIGIPELVLGTPPVLFQPDPDAHDASDAAFRLAVRCGPDEDGSDDALGHGAVEVLSHETEPVSAARLDRQLTGNAFDVNIECPADNPGCTWPPPESGDEPSFQPVNLPPVQMSAARYKELSTASPVTLIIVIPFVVVTVVLGFYVGRLIYKRKFRKSSTAAFTQDNPVRQ